MLAALAIPLLALIGLMLMQQLEDVLLPSAPIPPPAPPPPAGPAPAADPATAAKPVAEQGEQPVAGPRHAKDAHGRHARPRRNATSPCPNRRRHHVPIPAQRTPERPGTPAPEPAPVAEAPIVEAVAELPEPEAAALVPVRLQPEG